MHLKGPKSVGIALVTVLLSPSQAKCGLFFDVLLYKFAHLRRILKHRSGERCHVKSASTMRVIFAIRGFDTG